jgi:tellurite resistance protein TerC
LVTGAAGVSTENTLPPAAWNIGCQGKTTAFSGGRSFFFRPLAGSDRQTMLWIWTGFITFVLILLAIDLGVFHRKAHAVSVKEALVWSAVWITLALLFSIFVYFAYEAHWFGLGLKVDAVGGHPNDGHSAVLRYLTGYVIEKSLSVDNIFVFAMLFTYFAVPAMFQHRVLFWGILGALILRGAMIGIGAEMVARYHWILYIFGVFLIITAVKMLLIRIEDSDPARNPVLRFVRRFFRVTDDYHGQHFVVRAGAGLALTPLAVTLIVVETTDVVFAVDSIPAIFAITADPFLVFTSNVFAILGLRALYFALAGMMDMFRYLKPALAVVLAVVGVKMLLATQLKALLGAHANLYLLCTVMLILALGVVGSLLARKTEPIPGITPEPARAGAEQRPE